MKKYNVNLVAEVGELNNKVIKEITYLIYVPTNYY